MTGSSTDETETLAHGVLLAGRYRVVEPIGSGGMGHVYVATDERLSRRVAVKVMHADPADGGAHARAKVEAHLLDSLAHPNLVTLLDSHLDHDPGFFVMEHVDGPPLSHRLARGPLERNELRTLTADLADGLRAVHAAGVVHRDVKPSNILLDRPVDPAASAVRPFRAKLADFGIAQLVDSERLTSTQALIGTAAYVAPEQLQGGAPVPASDIYSLGLVLLEAATGCRAFGHDDGVHPLFERLARDPEIPSSLDPDWADLLRRMTARDTCERPDAGGILSWLTDGPRAARPERSRTAHLDIETVGIPLPPAAPAAGTADPTTAAPALRLRSRGRPTEDHRVGNRVRNRVRNRPARCALVTAAAAALVVGGGVLLSSALTEAPPAVDRAVDGATQNDDR